MSLIFQTQRLLLKPALEGDLNTLHKIFLTPSVKQYLCDNVDYSVQQIEEMLAQNQKLFDEQKLGLWLIETQNQSAIVGFVGLWYFFEENQPQLIYALLPEATRKGYATEAAAQIVEYCFNELGYEYLVASSDQPNVASHQVLQQLGMSRVEERVVEGSPIIFFRLDKA